MGKKQTQTTKFNQSTTPTNPQVVTDMVTGLAGTANDLAKIDPATLAPGTNQFHDMAGGAIGGLDDVTNSFLRNPMWQEFMNTGPQLANSKNAAGLIKNFLDPYTDSVVNSSLAQFDETAGAERAANVLRANGSNAFGGSGGAIAQMLGDRFTSLNRGQLEGGLRSEGFRTALPAALQQAAQDTEISRSNAQTSNDYKLAQMDSLLNRTALLGSEGRANAALQGDWGNVLRGIEQQQGMAPFTAAQLRAGIAGSPAFGLTHGENTTGQSTTTTKSSDPLGTLGSLAMLAAAPFTGGASLAGLGGLGGMFGGMGSLSAGLGGGGGLVGDWGGALSKYGLGG